MSKSFKIVCIISEIWSNEQCSKLALKLNNGFTKLAGVDVSINEILEQLTQSDFKEQINGDNWDFKLLINPDKDIIVENLDYEHYENILVVYGGIITNPYGHWILKDGIFNFSNFVNNSNSKIVIVTPSPCEDWNSLEKELGERFILCHYNEESDGNFDQNFILQITNEVSKQMDFSGKNPLSSNTAMTQILNVSEPTICVFLDKGCPTVPCLITLRGFTMLVNAGYGRQPECFKELSFCQQVDVGVLTHVAYNNIISFSMTHTTDKQPIPFNHLFLPHGVPLVQSGDTCNTDPLVIDLQNEVTRSMQHYKDRGTPHTQMCIKGKLPSTTALPVTLLKPIQLYHKIGYGSLEFLPLSPFSEDAEMKKFIDEWKKSKYPNDLSTKPLPVTSSFLIIWKPFNTKLPVKRLIYIGSKCNCKKTFPTTIVPSLYSAFDCLKQMNYTVAHGVKQKPKATNSAAKSSRPATAPAGDFKIPTTTVTKKTPRTAAPTSATSKDGSVPLNLKRISARPYPPTKPSNEAKKGVPKISNPIIDSKVQKTTKSQPSKTKAPASKTKTDAKPTPTLAPAPVLSEPQPTQPVVNGVQHTNENQFTENFEIKDKPVELNNTAEVEPSNQQNHKQQILAVGTVECAITEHGEADFCDDTPEELSVDQMRQLGLYDDDAGSMSPPTTVPPGNGTTSGHVTETTNLSQLPMEGSFYNKEIFDNDEQTNQQVEWNQPLSLPMPPPPTKTSSAKRTTPTTKPSTSKPIFVDSLIVPNDLDKDDLRSLFSCIIAKTLFLQLDHPRQISVLMEMLIELRSGLDNHACTVIPSLDDEASVMWIQHNAERLKSAGLNIATALSRCSILINGADSTSIDDVVNCAGLKWEL